jgi:hypothetical protein
MLIAAAVLIPAGTPAQNGEQQLDLQILGNIAPRGFRVLRDPGQEISFSLSGKNLLGAVGPDPGFSGVDHPLAPRSFFLQVNLGL